MLACGGNGGLSCTGFLSSQEARTLHVGLPRGHGPHVLGVSLSPTCKWTTLCEDLMLHSTQRDRTRCDTNCGTGYTLMMRTGATTLKQNMMLSPAVASVVASFCAKAACGAHTSCHRACEPLADGARTVHFGCAVALPPRPQPTTCSSDIRGQQRSAVVGGCGKARHVVLGSGLGHRGRDQGGRRATVNTPHMWHEPYAVSDEPAHADAVGHAHRNTGDDEHHSWPRQVPRLRSKPPRASGSASLCGRRAQRLQHARASRTNCTRIARESSIMRMKACGRAPPRWSAHTRKQFRLN